jgi:hypothetical protein
MRGQLIEHTDRLIAIVRRKTTKFGRIVRFQMISESVHDPKSTRGDDDVADTTPISWLEQYPQVEVRWLRRRNNDTESGIWTQKADTK